MEPILYKLIVSFILIGTTSHGYAVNTQMFTTVELCDEARAGSEFEVWRDLTKKHKGEVSLNSECVIYIKETDRYAYVSRSHPAT